MNTNSVVNFSIARMGCRNCSLSHICQPNDTSTSLTGDKIIRHNHQFSRGKHIFRINDEFNTVYAIRTGSIKTYMSIENGKEQVTGFHLPGELLGLEAISLGYHMESAVALESCTICEIPFTRLENLSHDSPTLQHALLRAMSEEIQYDHRQLTLISRMPAESRLASFLLSVSYNFKKRGLSPSDFHLSMTRSDIANLLGLAVETISRLFTQFQEMGLLAVERRHIVLCDMDSLEKLALQIEGRKNSSRHTAQEKAS